MARSQVYFLSVRAEVFALAFYTLWVCKTKMMIRTVVLSKQAKKQLEKLPSHIALKLLAWVSGVEKVGLEDVRKTPDKHEDQGKKKRCYEVPRENLGRPPDYRAVA
jgi:hypothetical protein